MRWLVFLFMISTTAWAQTLTTQLEPAADAPVEKPYSLEVTFDGVTKESRLKNRQENSGSSNIREMSLGLAYEFQKDLKIFAEGSAEDFDGESDFFISQAYLDISGFDRLILAQAGQIYYPVGWLTKEDRYFLNQPYYYENLYSGKKGLDVGAQVSVQPFRNELLAVTAACFEGRIFRDTDGRNGSAEKRPCAVGLTSSWNGLETYYTHFEHDLAFMDPVRADGVGLRYESPEFLERARVGVWGEMFRIESPQANGPTTVTTAGFIYPYADYWRFRVGYRHAPVKREVSYASLGQVESNIEDSLWRAEFEVFEPLRVIYEDQRAFQKSGVDLKDEWALRLLLKAEL